jgi:hypothetical protein
VIPQAGEGKYATVPHADVVGHLPAVEDLPLVEAVRRNEAASVLEGVISLRMSIMKTANQRELSE